MGCDIHPAIEVLPSGEAPSRFGWRLVAIPDATRCYEFFGVLAGVRRDGPPIHEPRGLPDPIGYDTEKAVNGDHSASWFTLAEALAFSPRFDDPLGLAWFLWGRWVRTMEFFAVEYGVAPDRVRAVFNFDS